MSRVTALYVAALTVLAGIAVTACAPATPAPPRPRLQLTDVLGGAAETGFARALEVRDFTFPEDHGPHPDFRSEWWYFTGNLESADGRRFGYQLTIFRTALAPPTLLAPPTPLNPPTPLAAPTPRLERSSAWSATDLFMGHFALTDIGGERFYAFDRFSRGALGLAGARARPWRVWLEDWSIEQQGDGPFPLRLRAHQRTESGGDAGDGIGIDLMLAPTKVAVLQGDHGLSRKGSGPGNASYYYSFTRLDTSGSVHIGSDTHQVAGHSWLDREWSTSALEEDQVGWDWFALQLDDDTELMFYRIRQSDGTASPHSQGIIVAPDGAVVRLTVDDVELRVDRTWISPIDGTEYPAAWTISVPDYGLSVQVEPYLAQQELDLAFRYWEGAVRISGNSALGSQAPAPGKPRATPRSVSGSGYVELTGYSLRTGRPR